MVVQQAIHHVSIGDDQSQEVENLDDQKGEDSQVEPETAVLHEEGLGKGEESHRHAHGANDHEAVPKQGGR